MRKLGRFPVLFIAAIVMVGIAVLAGCKSQTPASKTKTPAESETAKTKPKSSAPGAAEPQSKEGTTTNSVQNDDRAVIETDKGKMVIELYPDVAPKTVDNFRKLIQKGFYNGLTFHRVEPGFVIQGGDPDGNGSGGPGYTIPAEFNEKPHIRGTVAMARAQDPDSAGSQFYVALDRLASLDRNYTVFGQVVEGIDVIDKIAVGDKMNRVYLEPTKPN